MEDYTYPCFMLVQHWNITHVPILCWYSTWNNYPCPCLCSYSTWNIIRLPNRVVTAHAALPCQCLYCYSTLNNTHASVYADTAHERFPVSLSMLIQHMNLNPCLWMSCYNTWNIMYVHVCIVTTYEHYTCPCLCCYISCVLVYVVTALEPLTMPVYELLKHLKNYTYPCLYC